MEADLKPVRDFGDLQRALASMKDQVLLLIKRKGASVFVVLALK